MNTCPAAVSLIDGKMVHNDHGLYPAYCCLEEGHSGNHVNPHGAWWEQEGSDPVEQEMVARVEGGAL